VPSSLFAVSVLPVKKKEATIWIAPIVWNTPSTTSSVLSTLLPPSRAARSIQGPAKGAYRYLSSERSLLMATIRAGV